MKLDVYRVKKRLAEKTTTTTVVATDRATSDVISITILSERHLAIESYSICYIISLSYKTAAFP